MESLSVETERKVIMKMRFELVLEEYGLLKSSLAVLQFMGFFRDVTGVGVGGLMVLLSLQQARISILFPILLLMIPAFFFLSFWDNSLWLRNV